MLEGRLTSLLLVLDYQEFYDYVEQNDSLVELFRGGDGRFGANLESLTLGGSRTTASRPWRIGLSVGRIMLVVKAVKVINLATLLIDLDSVALAKAAVNRHGSHLKRLVLSSDGPVGHRAPAT